jgi:hypothetical protein
LHFSLDGAALDAVELFRSGAHRGTIRIYIAR